MDDIAGILVVGLIFGAPVVAWVISRVLAHQERMEMIRHGVIPPPMQNDRWARRQMKYGGWQAGPMPGMGPMPGPMPGMNPNAGWCGDSGDPSFYAQRQLRKGITVAAVGAALLIGLSFINPGQPGPWLLGGLIPLFVGIAQVISAVLNGAQTRFFNPGQPINTGSFGPRPGVGPMGADVPPNPTSSTPYAGGWRPGATPGLEKPTQPPDVR